MHEIFVGTRYKFMSKRKYFYGLSIALTLMTIISLVVHHGPRKSVDFTGGNVMTVNFYPAAHVDDVRDAVGKGHLEGAEVQMAQNNTEAIIRFPTVGNDTSSVFTRFDNQMKTKMGIVDGQKRPIVTTFRSMERVGPKIGKELEQKAMLAILWSQVLILIYIAWRFRRVSFGLGAVIALFHDVVIALGVLSVFNREISLTVIAAFLTISGYSVNDTIVVFDRIRENIGLLRRMSFADVIDKSVNQTLSRTILTSGLTLLSVISLFFLGGPVLHDFALALLVGFIVGTYSSIFVASAIGMDLSNWWVRRKARAEAKGKATKTTVAASS